MFLNAIMLAGLAVAVVPLVVHLLGRLRCRSVDWGAMAFLTGSTGQHQRSTRLRERVLLALRILIIAALALAMAQPLSHRGGSNLTCVILIDCSPSMAYSDDGQGRLERAREAARQVLRGLDRGSRAALIPMSGRNTAPINDPTADLQTVANALADARVGREPADIRRSLQQAEALFRHSGAGARELYILTDQQASNWRGVDDDFVARWKADLAKSGIAPRVVVVPVGGRQTDCVSIEAAPPPASPVVKGLPWEVEVRLHNQGSRKTAVPLSLRAMRPDSEDVAARRQLTVSLEANTTSTVQIPVIFNFADPYTVQVKVDAPGLPGDQSCDLAVDVVDRVKVLVVSGDERPGPYRGESAFLKLALAPFGGRRAGDAASVTVVDSAKWTADDLRSFSVVVLANLPLVTAAQVKALEQFTYEGGGLLIAGGNLTRIDNYNSQLWRNGNGLMPARLSAPAEGDEGTTIIGIDSDHPVFRFCRGIDPTPSAVIWRHFGAAPRPSQAQVRAWYASGEPFVVEGITGRGRVLLVTTALDADWSTLPLSSFYLPMMQWAVCYLAGGGLPNRNLAAGEPLITTFDESVDPRSLALTGPGDRKIEPRQLELQPLADRLQVRFDQTDAAGIYRLRAGSGGRNRIIPFVVRRPAAEQDLSSLTSADWEQLQNRLGFQRIELGDQPASRMISRPAPMDLWAAGLGVVVGLSVLEMLLAARWARGRLQAASSPVPAAEGLT